MSHRKVYSQGSIPFSWEDSPGVCKLTHQEFPIDIRLHALKRTSSQSPIPTSDSAKVSADDINIPLPPCPLQPPRRSTSIKGHQWHEDPFLVAYKECTKSVATGKPPRESKKGIGSKLWKSPSIFSCKNSCEVKEGNILKLSQLPPLPRYNFGVSRRERREFLWEHRARDQDI